MANIKIPKIWDAPYIKPIEEQTYLNRRQILKQLGLVTGGLLSGPSLLFGCDSAGGSSNLIQEGPLQDNNFTFSGMDALYPATRKEKYKIERPMTDEYDATHYNNFYEFISPDDPNIYNVYKYVGPFDTRDWDIQVSGYVENKGKFQLQDLIKKFGLEERVYRFRCVERWAMAVPWTGFPLSQLIKFLGPTSKATHLRMTSYSNPDQMIGVKTQDWYSWPYFEGLTLAEANNELAFMATGLFGKPLPKQNGAPVRLIVPWKYGYKNTKAITRIEFISKEPETFWHKIAPNEYGFVSNVNPERPHPRWSQAYERMIPDGEPRPTLKYNGYGEFVAGLYES